jgi:hypothetical protein
MPASESEQRHADIVPAIFLKHPPVVSGVAPPGGWYVAPSHESQFAIQQPASSSEITGADAAGLSQEGQQIPEVPSPQYDERGRPIGCICTKIPFKALTPTPDVPARICLECLKTYEDPW